MKTINIYQIWKMGALSDDESPMPLFLEYEDSNYVNVLTEFRKRHEDNNLCAIFVATKMVTEEGDDKLIYESPDHGKTIYVRKFGSADRQLLQDARADMVRGLWKIK